MDNNHLDETLESAKILPLIHSKGDMVQIALIEDDAAQAELLQSWLNDSGHDCYLFSNGKAFFHGVKRFTFDLIILDWMLPDTTGPELLTWIRENIDWHIPVLFTTSRDNEQDIVHALSRGADDYMVKPIKQQETLARLEALLRRAQPEGESRRIFEAAPYTFDTESRALSQNGTPLELTHKEYDLALFMFRHAGRLLSRNYLLENIWGQGADLQTRTVDTHISRIRKKLAIGPGSGWRLASVYQHGYRLEKTFTDNPS